MLYPLYPVGTRFPYLYTHEFSLIPNPCPNRVFTRRVCGYRVPIAIPKHTMADASSSLPLLSPQAPASSWMHPAPCYASPLLLPSCITAAPRSLASRRRCTRFVTDASCAPCRAAAALAPSRTRPAPHRRSSCRLAPRRRSSPPVRARHY